MKVCVVKIGGRIANNGGVGSGEALSLIKILNKADIEVDVYTKKLEKEPKNLFPLTEVYNVEEYENKNYDCLIIINGTPNFFGGLEDKTILETYKIIQNFEGKIFYFLCDPLLIFKQVWSTIKNKEWSKNYSEKELTITKEITYVCQSYNIEKLQKIINKNDIPIKNIVHFPFEKFPLLVCEDNFINKDILEYDLSYGGTFRSGRREDDIIKFYFGYDKKIKVELFGNIKEKQFKKDKIKELNCPVFNPPVNYLEYNKKMSKTLSTIIIGDKIYKELDNIAQRTYEAIKNGNIIFIDESYDKNKRIFSNNILRNFSYVNDREDVIKRLFLLKEKPDYINKIIDLQKTTINFDENLYANTLKNILNE